MERLEIAGGRRSRRATISKVNDRYIHGHAESVLRSHRWRTAENSARFLLGALRPGQRLLDVGCGPGTITLDLAALVAPGRVVGIDRSAEVIAAAEANRAAADVANVVFTTGDVHHLVDDDASFDVVHAHQVLQHLSDPVGALAEMRRVLRAGGVLAVRDSDYGGFVWSPADARLDRWLELYHQVAEANHADADAGRHLLGWVRSAGFDDATMTSSTWTFADPVQRAWWGELWADRVQTSSLAEQAIAYGFSDADELAEIAEGWTEWAHNEAGVFIVVHAEVLAHR